MYDLKFTMICVYGITFMTLLTPYLASSMKVGKLWDSKAIKVTKLEQCPEHKHMSISLRNLTLNNAGLDKFAVSGTTVITKVVEGQLTMLVNISKCYSKDTNAKCEHHSSPDVKNLCDPLKDKDSLVRKFFRLFGMDCGCPIHIGKYDITPDDFNIEYLKPMMMNMGTLCRVRISLINAAQEVLFCINAQSELIIKENRRKI